MKASSVLTAICLPMVGSDCELLRGRKLSDYQLVNGSTIIVCVRVRGGSVPLKPIPDLIDVTVDQPDMITLDDSPTEPRAIMPCGHVISKQLFPVYYIHLQLRSRKYECRTRSP